MADTIQKLCLEPTSRCNLNCAMCFRHTWFDEGFGDLPFEVVETVLEAPCLAGTQTVFFGGMGEPLVHPRILDMVAAAGTRGFRVELLTNGTLLTNERCQSLLEAGLSELWLSVDGLTQGVGTDNHGSQFSLVQRNLIQFQRLREEFAVRTGKQVDLGLTFVAMKNNADQMFQLPAFAEEWNAAHINLSHVLPNTPETEREILYERLLDDEEGTLSNGLGAPVRRRGYCRFVEEGHNFIRWDGNVSPCMGLLHSGEVYLHGEPRKVLHHSFGNVKKQSLEEIWSSPAYAAFRRRVRAFDFSPCVVCGGCDNRKSNQEDCLGSPAPTCGACLWSEGILFCP